VLIAAAKAGNVVAWWRLKARAGTQLPATAQGITAPGLSSLEREALIAVMGAAAAQPSGSSAISGMAARGQVWTAMQEGWGQPLEVESWRVLKAAGAPVSPTPPPSTLPASTLPAPTSGGPSSGPIIGGINQFQPAGTGAAPLLAGIPSSVLVGLGLLGAALLAGGGKRAG